MKEKSDEKPKHHKSRGKMGAFKVTITAEDNSESGNESCGLVIAHALSVGPNAKSQWILDSGATCHMCNDKTAFDSLHPLPSSTNVTVGDGRSLPAAGKGNVTLNMNLPEGRTETCTLHDVLYVPDLAYNLLSITSASKRGKVAIFTSGGCEIRNLKSKLIASGYREGNLYYLNQKGPLHRAYPSLDNKNSGEILWHRRLGHLGAGGMRALVKGGMVSGMGLVWREGIGLCKSCVEGKNHRQPFQCSTERTTQPLELIHSDICGKIGMPSLSGGEYFVTFTDDYTRHVWVY